MTIQIVDSMYFIMMVMNVLVLLIKDLDMKVLFFYKMVELLQYTLMVKLDHAHTLILVLD